MIIGHLPAGYIASKLISKKIDGSSVNIKIFIIAGVIGAIAPDFDMLYFHFVDNRQHHHHTYWPHYPVFWIVLSALSIFWYQLSAVKSLSAIAWIFSVCGFIHMLLDSIVGDIWWFAPFIDQPYAVFTVQAVYKLWWLNFILHWSFAIEVGISLWALYLWQANKLSEQ
jgi:inner membrane protein